MATLDNVIWQNSWALWLLPLIWLLFLGLAWSRRFKPFAPFLLRLTVFVLLILALAQPAYVPPPSPPLTQGWELNAPPDSGGAGGGRLVILVDQSASLGEVGQRALQAEAMRLARLSPDSYILQFADQTRLVAAPLLETPSNSPMNPNITNLAEALTAGAALLTPSSHLILLSDGVPTGKGDVLAEVAKINAPIEVLMPSKSDLRTWRGGQNEVALTRLQVPLILREGETFNVELNVYSELPTDITLNLTHNGETIAEDVVPLIAGDNPFTFETKVNKTGAQTFVATIAPPDGLDGQAENNRLAAVAQVYPPPQILLVSEAMTATEKMAELLDEAGFKTTYMVASKIPTKLSPLEPYAGMVLINVSARSLQLPQMVAIQAFVRSLGRGLLVTGGRNSLSLGSYEDTPLAALLPTNLEAPPREERPPVALLLVIDHSGSMVEDRNGIVTKLAMAKEAAIRATDILGPDDLVGVLMFDNHIDWVVPFQKVSDGAALLDIQQRVAQVPPGGGTRVLQALAEGLPALAEQPVPDGAKLAVLLTDGRSFDGLDKDITYEQIVNKAVDAGINLSTIAMGNEADKDLLMYLADLGHGRYHFASVPEELPALTIAESDILQGKSLQENEDFEATVYRPHPILRDLFSGGKNQPSPKLTGYLALTPKPLAEIALQTGPGDPLLSVWGYGLGRVAEWSSDLGQEWAGAWVNWHEGAKFWGQVVGYTLPAPDLGLLQLQAEVNSDGVTTFIANGVTVTGETVDLAQTKAILTSPSGRETAINLLQVAPGRYQQAVRLAEAGAYQLSVMQMQASEKISQTAMLGFVMPYPAEFAILPEGAGQQLLQTIADMSHGQTFTLGQALRLKSTHDNLPLNRPKPIALWPYLLAVALLLWPLEIAWRRWARLRIQ